MGVEIPFGGSRLTGSPRDDRLMSLAQDGTAQAPRWAIIADDMTGACDAAAPFAARGWPTVMGFSAETLPADVPIRVVSVDSRALPPVDAARQAARVARALSRPGDRIFKKIDSTLRGNPGEELRAVLSALSGGEGRGLASLVCPAFPRQGRVVMGGQVLVRGAPLAQTEFAAAVRETDMAQVFSPCRHISLPQARGDFHPLVDALSVPSVFLCDAETEDDLRRLALAGAAAGIDLYCGSAGLATALAELLPQGVVSMPPPAVIRPVLVVVGSRSAATARQVEQLSEVAVVFSIHEQARQSPAGESGIESTIEQLARAIRAGNDAALYAGGLPWLEGGEEQVAALLGETARAVMLRAEVGGLALTGGDTAAAVFRSLGCKAFSLGGEVVPGVAWGATVGGQFSGMPVVTKAGGFGDPAALRDALYFLHTRK